MICEMGRTSDKAILDKFDHRSMVDRSVRHIVFLRKWRHYDIGNAEAELRRKSVLSGGIVGVRTRFSRSQVAMLGSIRQARQELVWIHRDAPDIAGDP